MTQSRLLIIAAVALSLNLNVPLADAQDMSFSIDETGQPPAPPAEGPPSEALANALRLYQQERYAGSAVQFQRVVQGDTQDAPANVQKAQFFLGKCLYHLRYYQSALAIFDEIGQQGQAHLYFNQTLQWLAQLASQLPEPAGIIEKIGRYGVEELAQFDTPESAALYHQLIYLMGRYKYSQGEFEEAVSLLERVPNVSPLYVKARFFAGIAHIRMRRASPAVSSFRAIVDAINEGTAVGVEDEARMLNLAWISLARVYYTAAYQRDSETDEVNINGQLLGQAVESWSQVDQSSEYWLDSLFESSWAFFLADEYARSLGNVHTLFSPYFEASYYPEAMVIKAVTFFVNCQFDNASAVVRNFHDRYDPVQAQLQETLGQYEGSQDFFDFLRNVRSGDQELPTGIRGLVTTALSDRTVLLNLEYVTQLESELTRLEAAAPEFANTALATRIRQDVQLATSYAVQQTGDLVRGRYERLIRELNEHLTRVDEIELEITTAMRGDLEAAEQQQMTAAARSTGGNVEVDEEHQLWPFDGEYWRDELGFYRQQVTNVCGR